MRVGILSIGSELLRGDIIDTNSAWLAQQLSRLGFPVVRIQATGDELTELTEVIQGVLATVDVLVCTGGLGPTADDLTREAIAAALDEELYLDNRLLAEVEARFSALRRPMPVSNRKQAALIPSARAIPNPNGSAPGWLVRDGRTTIVAMPGPPKEMRPMWTDSVESVLATLLPGALVMRSLMTFGLGESSAEERIRDVIDWHPGVTVATYAKDAGVQVHITARADSSTEANALLDEANEMLRQRLGDAVFGTGDTTLAGAVGTLLVEGSLTVSTMESCTAGGVADMLTNIPGSSEYFAGGIIAYTREAKRRYGIETEVMDRHGLISREVASAMARSARRQFDTAVGLGTTGIAGTEPMEGKDPGTCFVGISMDGIDEVREIHRPGSRESCKHFFTLNTLDLLRRELSHHRNESI